MGSTTRFLHISDTHFGPTKDFDFYGKNPYQDTERLVAEIQRMPVQPDFIIHTGDVISYQSADAYKGAQDVLERLNIPLYFATGNHDEPSLLKKFPLFAKRTTLVDRDDCVSYYFELNSYLFIVLDAKHSDDGDPSGVLSDDQLQALASLLKTTQNRFVVFTHFPALPLDAPWIDSHLLISNGSALHAILKDHAKRSLGVFYGHIHQPTQTFKDGIQYISVPSTTFQFASWATDTETLTYNLKGVPGMNLVTLTEDQVTVKLLTIPYFL